VSLEVVETSCNLNTLLLVGVGLGNQPAWLMRKKAESKFVTRRWRDADVLIIDESASGFA
jgi:hypothetical protein